MECPCQQWHFLSLQRTEPIQQRWHLGSLVKGGMAPGFPSSCSGPPRERLQNARPTTTLNGKWMQAIWQTQDYFLIISINNSQHTASAYSGAPCTYTCTCKCFSWFILLVYIEQTRPALIFNLTQGTVHLTPRWYPTFWASVCGEHLEKASTDIFLRSCIFKMCSLLSYQVLGFPGGLVIKNLPANAGKMGSILGPGRPHMLLLLLLSCFSRVRLCATP